jgi:hypothetical protein
MNAELKPRRRWKVRKSDYLATIAALQIERDVLIAERDTAQADAWGFKLRAEDLSQRMHRAIEGMRAIAICSSVVAFFIGWML